MDIFKILGALGAIIAPIGLYLNYVNFRKQNNDKTLDRLKQISEGVMDAKPNKWWIEQVFESVY